VLHHLDGEQAVGLIKLAHSALRKGGRLVTIDPCYAGDQNLIPVFWSAVIADRMCGLPSNIAILPVTVFWQVTGEVRHRVWIPYTTGSWNVRNENPF